MAPKKLAAVSMVDEETPTTEQQSLPAPTSKSKPPKVPKKRAPRVKKPKMPRSVPTVIKVKVSKQKSAEALVNGTIPNPALLSNFDGFRHLAREHLIHLANEVAQAQLSPTKPYLGEVPVNSVVPLAKEKKQKGAAKAGTVKREKKSTGAVKKTAKKRAPPKAKKVKTSKPRVRKKNKVVLEQQPENHEESPVIDTPVIHRPVMDPTFDTPVINRPVIDPTFLYSPVVDPPAKKSKPRGGPRIRKGKEPDESIKEIIAETPTPEVKAKKRRGRPKKNVSQLNNLIAAATSEVTRDHDMLSELRNFNLSSPSIGDASTKPISGSIRTSLSDLTDNFSWAKDISSSNTTTPEKQLVCIDGKVPAIKLIDCKNILKRIRFESDSSIENPKRKSRKRNRKDAFDVAMRKKIRLEVNVPESDTNTTVDKTSSEVDKTSSEVDKTSSEIDKESNIDSICPIRSLDLSSSTTTYESTKPPTKKEAALQRLMQKVNSTVNSLDIELIYWVGDNENSINKSAVKNVAFKILKLEADYMKQGTDFRRRFSNSTSDRGSIRNSSNRSIDSNVNQNAFDIVPAIIKPTKEVNKMPVVENTINTSPKERVEFPDAPIDTQEVNRRKSYDQSLVIDDEDAISLFAESMTGLESSRYNGSNTSYLAPYSPKYENENSNDTMRSPEYDYTKDYDNISLQDNVSLPDQDVEKQIPALISNDVSKTTEVNFKRTICEKQNADSTSINKEEKETIQTPNIVNRTNAATSIKTVQKPAKPTFLIADSFKPTPSVKSVIFRGVCFFNLVSNCKRNHCGFPHKDIDMIDLKNRLKRVSEKLFIEEYMLMRKYPELKRKFMDSFVEEAESRDLTEILLEMAIDTVAGNFEVRTQTMEAVLLHLNDKDLSKYKQYLQYSQFNGTSVICDEFIRTIADTQNFTRFKQVFVKLVQFIVNEMKRPFDLDVASKIFERICILPPEDSLNDAVILILMNTDVEILNNSLMNKFEDRLAESNMGLYEEFIKYKNLSGKAAQLQMAPSPKPKYKTIEINMASSGETKKRYTSPDTTNLDSLQNKFETTPILSRTTETKNPTSTYIRKPTLPAQYNQETTPTTSSANILKQPLLRPPMFHSRPSGSNMNFKHSNRGGKPLFRTFTGMNHRIPRPGTPANFQRRPRPDSFY